MQYAHHVAAITMASLTTLAPALASAQDDERAPLKLVVLDVAQKGGASATKSLARELQDLDLSLIHI